jgi:crotonobetainyl-CoA:carnitine CoA-transferase CaiB-like acyl-CoA transferase
LLGGSRARYRLYQTGHGWIAVAALEEHFWQRLCEKLGFQDVDISAEELQEIFLARTAVEWETWAASFDLPIAAVR